MPLAGRLADRIGRKRIFQLGLLAFALSAFFSATAGTVITLNLSRVLQAFAGAAILPSSLALVLPLFPESRRTTAVGLWSAAGPLGAGVAPGVAALILAECWLANCVFGQRPSRVVDVLGRSVTIERTTDAA